MKVLCTPIKTSEEDIRTKLQQEGKFNFNHLLIRNKEITGVELRYVEYFVLKYHMIHKRSLLSKKPDGLRYTHQNVNLLGNGSTGTTSLMETLPEMVTVDVDARQLQKADYGPDKMHTSARTTMIKMNRRHAGGGIPQFELQEAVSLYRPFWLVYYGDARKDGRRLCSVRPADGFTVGKW